MAHIVAEPCIKCKYTDCVAVCPVDCFHEGVNFLVIDPGLLGVVSFFLVGTENSGRADEENTHYGCNRPDRF